VAPGRRRAYDPETVRLPLDVPPPTDRAFDVVGFGLNSIDLLIVVAEFPTSNTKQRLQRFSRQPGGQMATAAATCARLGWRARYVGSFGDDDIGRLSQESLTNAGVDISACRIVAGAANQFAVILVDGRSGERTVLWDRDPALTYDPLDVPLDAIVSGRLLIVDCHQTAAAAQAARYARHARIPTIVDVEKVRPGIADLLENIDVIIAAQEFPAALTGYEELGKAIEVMAREFGALVVTATLGAEGSLTWCGGREIRTPAFQVDCVDTTGAGDVFRGAFAAGCLRSPDEELEDVLTYANAVAALNCRALGSRGGLPAPVEVEQLLLARPHL
jgi:sugar/nucleoside kinase (ribokinase family)